MWVTPGGERFAGRSGRSSVCGAVVMLRGLGSVTVDIPSYLPFRPPSGLTLRCSPRARVTAAQAAEDAGSPSPPRAMRWHVFAHEAGSLVGERCDLKRLLGVTLAGVQKLRTR